MDKLLFLNPHILNAQRELRAAHLALHDVAAYADLSEAGREEVFRLIAAQAVIAQELAKLVLWEKA